MTESFVSNDFLSKDNIGVLYKHVTMANNMNNLNKQQKDQTIGIVIDTMKKVFKTLDLSKINKTNMIGVKKQFNEIVIKQASEIVKNSLNKPDTSMNDRMAQRDFNSVVRPMPVPNDRPTAVSFGGNPHGPAPTHASVDFMRNATADLSTRLREIEDARRGDMRSNQPPEVPDFLKPTKVGKPSESMPPPGMGMNFGGSAPGGGNFGGSGQRPLLGFNNDSDSNFSSNVPRSDPSKYNESLSVADRLKQMEAERGAVVPVAPPPGGNVNNLFNQPANSTAMPNTSAMFSNTIPGGNMPSGNMPNMPSSNMPTYNPQPPTQYNPNPTYQQMQPPPPENNQMNELLARMNEMQSFMMNLRNENEFLKSQLNSQNQKKTLTKNLQLEVTKKDSQYNFQLNPISNVIRLKLVQYNLPPPIYNIIDDMKLLYKTDVEKEIILYRGNYNISDILEKLNNEPNGELSFTVDFNQKITVKSNNNNFTIIPTLLWHKLGFINNNYEESNSITAERVYDIRPPNKLLLFIKNINPTHPVCSLNFNNTSMCDIPFNQPITLTNLEFEFYTEDGILYNFNQIMYNLTIMIEVIIPHQDELVC